ncbi:MAG: putative metal-dependent hydrolase [Azospira oryzae]|nr:MAG: putative metal-dependent hydrolase [Azospira oryzae]
MEDIIRYPIGKFTAKESYTPEELRSFIHRIEALPAKVEQAIAGFSEAQFNTPYREGGWTVKQLLHHLPDSHMNAYIRFKWTLTEETPTIKAYDEKRWAETPDTKADPALSVALLKALHAKWISLLKEIPKEELKRQFFHPDTKKYLSIDSLMGMYAWHGDHHLAHITSLKERNGW